MRVRFPSNQILLRPDLLPRALLRCSSARHPKERITPDLNTVRSQAASAGKAVSLSGMGGPLSRAQLVTATAGPGLRKGSRFRMWRLTTSSAINTKNIAVPSRVR